MKHVFIAFVSALALSPSAARAATYLTGSVSATTSNVPYQTSQSNYGSASLGVDLGRYIRLSLTHSQQFEVTEGYKERDDNGADATPDTNAGSDDDPTNDDQLEKFSNRTHVIGNSVDLQLILYEGQVFVPYLSGGLILKSYHFVSKEDGEEDSVKSIKNIPGPNLGLGLGMRLNKQFTLKLSYIASPGMTRKPFDESARSVWDKKVTMGVTYEL